MMSVDFIDVACDPTAHRRTLEQAGSQLLHLSGILRLPCVMRVRPWRRTCVACCLAVLRRLCGQLRKVPVQVERKVARKQPTADRLTCLCTGSRLGEKRDFTSRLGRVVPTSA